MAPIRSTKTKNRSNYWCRKPILLSFIVVAWVAVPTLFISRSVVRPTANAKTSRRQHGEEVQTASVFYETDTSTRTSTTASTATAGSSNGGSGRATMTAANKPYKPHIIFVVMDDLGSHDLVRWTLEIEIL